MSSSHAPFKPCFNASLEFILEGYKQPLPYIGGDQRKSYSIVKHGPSQEMTEPQPVRGGPPLAQAELVGPNFDSADVAAGLPEVEAALDALHRVESDITAKDSYRVKIAVGVRGGITGGEANLLARKITTLVMVLEESLLLKLVAPSRGPREVYSLSKKSKVAMHPGNAVSSDYNSHVPPMACMKPAAWNNRDPEFMRRMLRLIWSAPSLQELQYLLCARCPKLCDFYVMPPKQLPLDPARWWGAQEHPDPRLWWGLQQDNPGDDDAFRGPESFSVDWWHLRENHPDEDPAARCWGHTWFYFRYLQATFEHTLLRNWVEVIARIVELALASPDEYKRCLETIFMIQHEADQGGVAWEQLMKHILKLEHRIPDWRDQLARYERGEIITGLSEGGLLPKHAAPPV